MITTDERKKIGRKNRAAGKEWENKVRKDLESKGWTIVKFSNNVADGKLVPCRPKFNPFTKSMMMNSGGFPDFLCMSYEDYPNSLIFPRMVGGFDKYNSQGEIPLVNFKVNYIVFGIEVKSNGYLSQDEKEKCKWLLDNNIFSKILIASKGKKGEIIYKEWTS